MKNLHLEHLEDLMLYGDEGMNAVMGILKTPTLIPSIKWDGAPAIVAGIDPEDNMFFVSTKSAFNKTPIVYKSLKQIETVKNEELRKILSVAYEEFRKQGIAGVIQGDILFVKDTSLDLQKTVINGKPFVTFHPNTIVYALPKGSKGARTANAARIGVAWHTKYTGENLSGMSAIFDANIKNEIRQLKTVAMVDVSPGMYFYTKWSKAIQMADDLLLNSYWGIPHEIRNSAILPFIKTWRNHEYKTGATIGFLDYLRELQDKEVQSYKTPEKREQVSNKWNTLVLAYSDNKEHFQRLYEIYKEIEVVKNGVVDEIDSIRYFFDTVHMYFIVNGNYIETENEGYVIGKTKFVRRERFSYANFSMSVASRWKGNLPNA